MKKGLTHKPFFILLNALCRGINKIPTDTAVQTSWGSMNDNEAIKYARVARLVYPYQSGVMILSSMEKQTVQRQVNKTIHHNARNGSFTARPIQPNASASAL